LILGFKQEKAAQEKTLQEKAICKKAAQYE
jgi:hypothetical protein